MTAATKTPEATEATKATKPPKAQKAPKPSEWTYERLCDALSCLGESLETLYDTLKQSGPIAPPVQQMLDSQIMSLEGLRDQFKTARDEYYREHIFRGVSVEHKIVAPFGTVMSGNS
ncbi:hypothetical protein [Paraburkholderia sp. SIMBA_054]|uniref:hypothetical protein n=1 Tax=Paraburkholderia sp. SIMBA_054 TaxID=3085795 RepID=UPI003979FFC5